MEEQGRRQADCQEKSVNKNALINRTKISSFPGRKSSHRQGKMRHGWVLAAPLGVHGKKPTPAQLKDHRNKEPPPAGDDKMKTQEGGGLGTPARGPAPSCPICQAARVVRQTLGAQERGSSGQVGLGGSWETHVPGCRWGRAATAPWTQGRACGGRSAVQGCLTVLWGTPGQLPEVPSARGPRPTTGPPPGRLSPSEPEWLARPPPPSAQPRPSHPASPATSTAGTGEAAQGRQ